MTVLGHPLLAEQERRAREVLPTEVWNYYAGGSGGEVSLDEAALAWQRHRLRPHVLRNVADVSTATTVLGSPVASPVLIAPTALSGMAHADAERGVAAAARATGGLMVVSTRSSTRVEEVAAAAPGPWWLQVYVMRDRGVTESLVRRAAATGATALVLTGDTPYLGVKHRPVGSLPQSDPAYRINVVDDLTPGVDVDWASEQDPATSLADIGWLRQISGLPVVVKGVLRADDAVACMDAGAAAVVVSNHGGRQLDRAISTADALAGVADAVGGRGEVYVDGGIRDGVSILTALALGARAVLVGRPTIWALAAGGQAGVAAMLEVLAEDLRLALALAGAESPAHVDRSLVGTMVVNGDA